MKNLKNYLCTTIPKITNKKKTGRDDGDESASSNRSSNFF